MLWRIIFANKLLMMMMMMTSDTLELLNGTAWEVMFFPIGEYRNTMVQLPCPVN
jgi:hypothetical protein